jgi:hypothetical protein
MFRHRHRRSPAFSDFINWTDYRWEPNPSWPGRAAGPRPWAPHAPHPRRHSLLQVFLAGLAVVVGLKLMSSLRGRMNRSWLERSALAILLLIVASYVSRRRQRL